MRFRRSRLAKAAAQTKRKTTAQSTTAELKQIQVVHKPPMVQPQNKGLPSKATFFGEAAHKSAIPQANRNRKAAGERAAGAGGEGGPKAPGQSAPES